MPQIACLIEDSHAGGCNDRKFCNGREYEIELLGHLYAVWIPWCVYTDTTAPIQHAMWVLEKMSGYRWEYATRYDGLWERWQRKFDCGPYRTRPSDYPAPYGTKYVFWRDVYRRLPRPRRCRSCNKVRLQREPNGQGREYLERTRQLNRGDRLKKRTLPADGCSVCRRCGATLDRADKERMRCRKREQRALEKSRRMLQAMRSWSQGQLDLDGLRLLASKPEPTLPI